MMVVKVRLLAFAQRHADKAQADYRSSSRGFRDRAGSGAEYDEYEGADDFEEQPRPSISASTSRSSSKPQPPPKSTTKVEKPVDKPMEKPKEVNLFDFDDDPVSAPATSVPAPLAPVAADGECICWSVSGCS